MPRASSNGPDWIRSEKAARDRGLAGIAPIRRFLARIFGLRELP